MRNHLLVCVGLVVAGCVAADEPVDATGDAEAETAPADGKADAAASFLGVYASSASTLRDGDVPNLELLTGGQYVRNRCYHAACDLLVPETDAFTTFTSSAGKSYVRFKSFKIVPNATSGDRDEKPVVADTYEIRKTSTGISLRKTYTSRWLSLRKKTAVALCATSGGAWSADGCACPGPMAWPGPIFVAGLGGCTLAPGATEDNCDSSNGFYTDDDATLIGAYCRCGVGRYIADDGLCTDL